MLQSLLMKVVKYGLCLYEFCYARYGNDNCEFLMRFYLEINTNKC